MFDITKAVDLQSLACFFGDGRKVFVLIKTFLQIKQIFKEKFRKIFEISKNLAQKARGQSHFYGKSCTFL